MSLPIIDFHAHLMTLAGLEKVCPEEQQTPFFRHLVPILEPIAHLTEPVHDRFLRYLAMNYRNSMSRVLYARMGPLFLMEALRLFRKHGLEQLIHSMDRNGIKHSVIYSIEPLTQTREIIDLTKQYPERFSVFGSVSHNEPDHVGYLAPFIEAREIKGIKIHPMVGGFTSKELFDSTRELVALASEKELPVAIHTGHIPIEGISGLTPYSPVHVLEPIIRAFPKCKFILTHIGWEAWRETLDIASSCPNVMVETSWQPARIIRRAVERLGSSRVLFGSDFPLFQQDQALDEAIRALSPREFRVVCYRNAANLLHLTRFALPV